LELGKLYIQKKEYSNASPHFEKAQESEIMEMRTEASYYLGESEAAREKYNAAIAAYERIISYGISDMSWVSLAYVKIGVNKERLKLWDDAQTAYQKALEILEDKDLKTFAEERLKAVKTKTR
jgi:TolA-binding protein